MAALREHSDVVHGVLYTMRLRGGDRQWGNYLAFQKIPVVFLGRNSQHRNEAEYTKNGDEGERERELGHSAFSVPYSFMNIRRDARILAALLFVSVFVTLANHAARPRGAAPLPYLSMNQQYIDDARRVGVNLDRVEDVFAFVFSQLPSSVKVYPTENYYYYRFWSGGNEIWGNLRFDVDGRERGEISFAYFTFTEQPDGSGGPEPISNHKNVGPKDGLLVKERSSLVYDLKYQGKTVTFHLNDLPQNLPDSLSLTEDEEFLFRTFDESGFQLVFVYDRQANSFRYILDPTAPLPDRLREVAPGVVIGYRSGFAFYHDKEYNRRLLIGVRQENVRRNNYYDGPFDQLADNWLAATKFQEYATRVYPKIHINARGFFLDDAGERTGNRLAVQAYMQYRSLPQLAWLMWHCENNEEYFLGCLTRDPNTRGN